MRHHCSTEVLTIKKHAVWETTVVKFVRKNRRDTEQKYRQFGRLLIMQPSQVSEENIILDFEQRTVTSLDSKGFLKYNSILDVE